MYDNHVPNALNGLGTNSDKTVYLTRGLPHVDPFSFDSKSLISKHCPLKAHLSLYCNFSLKKPITYKSVVSPLVKLYKRSNSMALTNQQGGSLLSRSHQCYIRSKKRQTRKETLRQPPQQQMNKRLDSSRKEKSSSNAQWAKIIFVNDDPLEFSVNVRRFENGCPKS